MDLLQQSGYGDGDTDEGSTSSSTSRSSCRVDETTGVSDSASAGRKRKRGHAGQRDAQFIRSVPHTPGNWASHVFCPLVDTHPSSSPSASVFEASRYEGVNRAAGRRLCNAAQDIIAEFTEVLKDRQKERGETTSGLIVVSHLPANNCDTDDSSSTSSSDEDDHANNCDEKHDEKRKSNGKDIAATKETKNITTICKGNSDNTSFIPLHISLSRPFYLQEQSIESFVDHLTKALSIFAPIPITFSPNQPQVLVNDELTRTFLTIPALSSAQQQQQQSSDIIKLIRAIDVVMERFGQPTYYDHPRIHVSIASVPCDASDILAGLYRMPRRNGVGTNATNGGNKAKGVVDNIVEATPQKQNITMLEVTTPQKQNITFMVDRIICTFGGTKKHSVFLNG